MRAAVTSRSRQVLQSRKRRWARAKAAILASTNSLAMPSIDSGLTDLDVSLTPSDNSNGHAKRDLGNGHAKRDLGNGRAKRASGVNQG